MYFHCQLGMKMLNVSKAYVQDLCDILIYIYIYIYIGIEVYYYAFTTLDTHEAYAIMFAKIFQILENVSHLPIQFPHIYRGEQDIRTIILDMCTKQVPDMINICKK